MPPIDRISGYFKSPEARLPKGLIERTVKALSRLSPFDIESSKEYPTCLGIGEHRGNDGRKLTTLTTHLAREVIIVQGWDVGSKEPTIQEGAFWVEPQNTTNKKVVFRSRYSTLNPKEVVRNLVTSSREVMLDSHSELKSKKDAEEVRDLVKRMLDVYGISVTGDIKQLPLGLAFRGEMDFSSLYLDPEIVEPDIRKLDKFLKMLKWGEQGKQFYAQVGIKKGFLFS